MIKILNGFNWLDDLGENTKEVDECLEKGLIKYTYDEFNPNFMVLESNISAVKEILSDDYNKFKEEPFMDWLQDELYSCSRELEIFNSFDDKIVVDSSDVYNKIQEGELNITDKEKLIIYNAKNSADEMWFIANKLGKQLAKIRIMDLLDSLENYEDSFK